MDLNSRARWVEYSKAKGQMFAHTDIKQAPWYVVNADDKRCARLNCIRHLLSLISYEDLTPEPISLPPRQQEGGYVRPPITDQNTRGIEAPFTRAPAGTGHRWPSGSTNSKGCISTMSRPSSPHWAMTVPTK